MSFYYFGLAYVLTLVTTRVWLQLFPRHAPKIGNIQPHHYMIGLVITAAYLAIPNPILLGVGLALVVDEIPLMFMFKGLVWPDDHWKQYRSAASLLGVALASLFVGVAVYTVM